VGPRNGIVIGLLRPAESQNKVGVPYEYKQNLSFDYNRIDQISILTFPLILRSDFTVHQIQLRADRSSVALLSHSLFLSKNKSIVAIQFLLLIFS